jgi:hypothetical protein
VRELQQAHGYPLSEFAVLYPMRHPHAAPGVDLPVAIQKALDADGLLWRWASEDSRSKRDMGGCWRTSLGRQSALGGVIARPRSRP